MFAILETGGKQYKVQAGDIIEVERVDKKNITGENVIHFDHVLLIKDKDSIVGQPYVMDGRIVAKLLDEIKSPKVIIFKKKSKKGYRRTRGHRQVLHRIQVEKIEMDKSVKAEKPEIAAPKKAVAAEPEKEKKPVSPKKKPVALKPERTVEKVKKTEKKSDKKETAAKKKEKK